LRLIGNPISKLPEIFLILTEAVYLLVNRMNTCSKGGALFLFCLRLILYSFSDIKKPPLDGRSL
jgi:hypothetical protein